MSEQQQETATILDFWKGYRYIKGHVAEQTAKLRQKLRTEEGRLEMIRLREIADGARGPEAA